MEPIKLDAVAFGYPGAPALFENVTMELPPDGVVCLSGPSGSGKTTLLRLLAGLETPRAGRITGLAVRRTAVVFQEDRLLPWVSALDNVAVALRGDDARERAAAMLERVGLGGELDTLPAGLSGGMKRRVAIARALAVEADLLLLDEPFNGLDEALWQTIASLIETAYGPGSGRLAVLVTHVREQADLLRAVVLDIENFK